VLYAIAHEPVATRNSHNLASSSDLDIFYRNLEEKFAPACATRDVPLGGLDRPQNLPRLRGRRRGAHTLQLRLMSGSERGAAPPHFIPLSSLIRLRAISASLLSPVT